MSQVNIMVVGGEVHTFDGCTYSTHDGWLNVVDEHGEHIAAYANHRTVRAWYTGNGPKITKAA